MLLGRPLPLQCLLDNAFIMHNVCPSQLHFSCSNTGCLVLSFNSSLFSSLTSIQIVSHTGLVVFLRGDLLLIRSAARADLRKSLPDLYANDSTGLNIGPYIVASLLA